MHQSTGPALVRHLSLGGEAESGTLGVEDDVLALEEDITQDGEAETRVALNTANASGAALLERGVVDVLARDDGVVGADNNGEFGELGFAGKDVASSGCVVLGALDLLVVGIDDFVIEHDEGGTGVWREVLVDAQTWSICDWMGTHQQYQ